MPAATSKTDLHAICVAEFTKLETVLDKVPPSARLAPDADSGGASIKDIVGHRAYWISLFLGWYRDGQLGKDVALPAPGYKWNELKRFNADLRAAQVDLDWEPARAMLRSNHALLLDFVDGGSEADLYGAPMQGGNNHWTPGRWAEAAGPSHYRSAAKYIRARLKSLSASHPV